MIQREKCGDCPGRSSPLCCWEHHHPATNNSEVSRLMQRITDEREAMHRGMQGVAEGAAKHRFITARMERLWSHKDELSRAVGDESEATAMICRAILGDS